ncbi:MAG TPA: ATP-binding protein [Chloroflexota bacterium]|nr:ATP-binding protein [Chloroflexota bacterium]
MSPATSLYIPGFLETLQATLTGARDLRSIYSSVVHRLAAAFEVDRACLALYDPVAGVLEPAHQAHGRMVWDLEALAGAVREERTIAVGEVLAAPVIWPGSPGSDGDLGEKRVYGVLAVARPEPFASSDRRLLRAVAEKLAVELERRRVLLLDDVLDGLLRKTKPIDVYMHALRELRRFLRYDAAASVMTMQPGVTQLTVRVEKLVQQRGKGETLVDSTRRGRALRLTAPQTRYLEALRGPLLLRNQGEGWRPSDESLTDGVAGLWRVFCLDGSDPAAVLCYPLVFGGRMLGVLRLAARRPAAFDPLESHVPLLDRFARLLSVTLYRSELYHQNDRQLAAIKEISRAITEPLSVPEVCRQVLQVALRVLHAPVGAVGLRHEDGTLHLIAHQGSTLAELPGIMVGEGIAGAVVESGTARAVPNVADEPGYVVFNSRVCSELVAPIVYDREVIGFLDVESYEEGRFRPEDEDVVSFIEALANQAAIAIKTAQLRDEAMSSLSSSLTIDPMLSMAGLHDLLVDELRTKIEQLAAANDRLAAANRAKSDFLAQMSHDLRGPLNVMIGLSSLLVDPTLAPTLEPDKQRETLQLIAHNGEVLGAMIGNILDLSALEAGQVQLQIAPFAADVAFHYLQSTAEALIAEEGKEIALSIDVDGRVRAIDADEDKFLRILTNLLANAVKFTPSGGRIRVIVGPTVENERDLHISVRDTGPGIPAEHHERIFQAFQRLDGSASRQGTGLGLAIVRQLVELHAGRVWVESTVGEGATFHVVLPGVLSPTSPRSEGEETMEPAPVSNGAGPSRLAVLVVEDTPAHLDVMRLAVTARGHTMHSATSGEEALEWLADNRPDVILLDMQLPGIDGFAVASSIKARVETHAIPIIAVTADALTVSEERARASGCDDYLTKPIDIGRLLEAIEAVTR